jgi:Ca-activated chloride channel family protein
VTFSWPLVLAALVLVPVAAGLYLLFERRRRSGVQERWASAALLPYTVGEEPGWRRHVPIAVLLVALTALVVGAARPHVERTVAREDATVMLAVDVSYSMAAKDVQPTRLGAARSAALAFVRQAPKQVNIGLVSFETGAHLVVPPTTDRVILTRGLNQLRPGEGTAVSGAILTALSASGARRPNHRPVAILMLSDGAQTQGRTSPAAAAQQARSRQVPIYTVVLGTNAGIVERPLANGYKERIQVPPDPATLHRLADTSGGQFFETTNAQSLRTVYERLASKLGHRQADTEVTAGFAGLAGVLLLAGAALSALWFRRAP